MVSSDSLRSMQDRHGRFRRRPTDPRRRPSDGYRATDRARFERLVDDAVSSLPPAFLNRLENVSIVVEDVPPAGGLDGEDEILLGLYEGVPRTERGETPFLPDRITLYRRPLEARARTKADLATMIQDTVVHEVAHHFGIDDDRLDDLGWG